VNPRAVRFVVQADDKLVIVYADGEVAPVVPSGHPRPSGLSSEPVATRRERRRS
jgi:hypothetical protein